MSAEPLIVDVVSDVMCPWCYIGKRRLEQALALAPEINVDIRWRPFQLDGTIPEGGMSRREYLANKFGGDDGARQVYARIEEAGEAEDLPFAFDMIEKSPNTLNAHRVIRWAMTTGHQGKLVEELFRRFFVDGEDIGDSEILADAAEAAGMERDIVERLLAGDNDKNEVKAEIEQAQKIGVTGVPCFIIDQKYAIMGAQQPETLVQAFRQALAEREAEAS
ncbi:MAG: DsbA family oxidoreductase [Pseudomonadota bacterium]